MARTKARENYGTGSVIPIMITKKDSDGNVLRNEDGTPVKVQERDKDGKPVWKICLTIGEETYVTKSGGTGTRQKRVSKRFHGTLKEARACRKRMAEDYKQINPDATRKSFTSLIDSWKDSSETSCGKKQLEQYVRHLKYLAPILDRKPLIELKRPDIEEALSAVENSRHPSITTYNKILQVTRRVFEYALDCDYIVRNPCRGIKPKKHSPATQENKREALSEERAAELCSALVNTLNELYLSFSEKEKRQLERGNAFDRHSISLLGRISEVLAVLLLLATGARRGEVLGLQWKNLDTDKGTMRIAQTLNEECEIKTPKTDAGYRNLFLDIHTLAIFKKWENFQRRNLHLLGKTQNGDTYVFCTDVGTSFDPTNFGRWWNNYRETIGFGGLLIHELRHSHITILRGHNISDEMLHNRVGHILERSVTDRYAHETPANDREAADVIGRVLYEKRTDADDAVGDALQTA